MATTVRITYRGGVRGAHILVGELRGAGIAVDWQPPQERRDLPGMAEAVVASIVAAGAYDTIRTVVAAVKERQAARRTDRRGRCRHRRRRLLLIGPAEWGRNPSLGWLVESGV